jgi:VWFA-related protein
VFRLKPDPHRHLKVTRRAALSGLAAALTCAGQQEQPVRFRLDVDLVTLPFTAADHDGKPVHDLQISDLVLQDNGQSREIRHLWRYIDVPLTVGLVADVSLTQAAYIAQHRATIVGFLHHVLQAQDRAFVVTAAAEVALVMDLTNSLEDLTVAINKIDSQQTFGKRLGPECPPRALPPAKDGTPRSITGCGGSELWDAIFYSARLKMKPLPVRKAFIFLSDGIDTGSVHDLTDAIEAAQGADTLVYTIYYRSEQTTATPGNLLRLTQETGGRSLEVTRGGLSKAFARIEEDLRSIYVLAFSPPAEARDGRFRRLKLASRRKGTKLRTRPGYALPLAR